MKVKDVVVEDFVNYKLPSLFVIFPSCTFKCEKESGVCCCQNSDLANTRTKDIGVDVITSAYLSNPITKAVVFGGLEPFDSFNDMVMLISSLRRYTDDDIVIYTGYYKNEIEDKIKSMFDFRNIIVKYGRFIPDQKPHYDDVLGVELASDNQYAERIC